jgi:threonine dehydrogenase-like Zn-dependent dehydrogenase
MGDADASMSRSQTKGERLSRKSVGAVIDAAGTGVRIEELQIDPPGPGEVLVRLVASGVCHSDLWAMEHGNWGAPFPMLLGHEGAGIVEEVGDGVETRAAGDPVHALMRVGATVDVDHGLQRFQELGVAVNCTVAKRLNVHG